MCGRQAIKSNKINSKVWGLCTSLKPTSGSTLVMIPGASLYMPDIPLISVSVVLRSVFSEPQVICLHR